MAKLDLSMIKQINAAPVIEEIQKWQDELSDRFEDEIIYDTLDTVIDIIVNNSEEI